MKKIMVVLVILMLCITFLVGCSTNSNNQPEDNNYLDDTQKHEQDSPQLDDSGIPENFAKVQSSLPLILAK